MATVAIYQYPNTTEFIKVMFGHRLIRKVSQRFLCCYQTQYSWFIKSIGQYLCLLICAASFSAPSLAQQASSNIEISQASPYNEKSSAIISGTRLSEWLLQSQKKNTQLPAGKEIKPYPLGTSWYASAEIQAQTEQKNSLLQMLDSLPAPSDEPSFDKSRAALRSLIHQMPVTGRVSLPSSDPRYLEVQPKLNPILNQKDRVRVPIAPSSITVIRSDGLLCKVRYQPNVEARQYFRACRAQSIRTDWAWIIEPDGVVKKVSTAAWNEAKQDVPAPGSWIWAPPRGSAWTSKQAQDFSEKFSQFLATQNLSGEAGGADELSPERKPATLSEQDKYYYSRDLPISANIWGETGLLQTPSARTAPAGTASISMGWFQPYANVNLVISPLDGFEFYMRYTNINDVPYGSQALAGGQSYKDKSTGLKIRMLKEELYIPEFAVGVRDLLGTGLFSGEYFVASKRYSDLDFSVGMGWGQLGTRNNVTNPFVSAFGSSFSTRDAAVVGSGGTPNQQYFHGTAALFGGVQYHTPWDPLVLKVEVDGNNYQQLPFGNTLPIKSIFNFGATYQMKNVDFTVASLGNSQVMLTIGLHERLDLLSTPKLDNAKPISADLKTVGSYTPTNPGLQILMQPTVTTNKNSASADKPQVLTKLPKTRVITSAKASTPPDSTGITQTLAPKQANQNATSDPATGTQSSIQANYEQTLLDFEAQTHWQVNDLRATHNAWVVDLSDASGISITNRISLGVAALHRDAPSQIETFYLKLYNWGMLVSEFKIDRKQWMLAHTQLLPPSQRRNSITVSNTLNDADHPFFGQGFANAANVTPASVVLDAVSKVNPSAPSAFDRFTQSLTPTADEIAAQKNTESSTKLVEIVAHKPYETNLGISYAQVVGSPSAPFLFALGVKADGTYKFRENTWVNGMLNLRVVDNFGKYNYDPPPTGLQPVRTNIRQYMTQSLATMPNLQVTNTGKLSNNQFVSAYAGYLEVMFAGVGGEYLWRPTNSRLAIGADLNRVRQRQFNVWTSMQNYSVTTGHLTTYWDTGVQDILLKFSYGKYLAGDVGGTLDVSKVFQNGVKVGAYATRTNVDYAQYGEGSFDKGLYVMVPFDAFFARHSDSVANLLFTPLIRDGGDMLMRKYKLYDMTRTRDNNVLALGPGE